MSLVSHVGGHRSSSITFLSGTRLRVIDRPRGSFFHRLVIGYERLSDKGSCDDLLEQRGPGDDYRPGSEVTNSDQGKRTKNFPLKKEQEEPHLLRLEARNRRVRGPVSSREESRSPDSSVPGRPAS